ncbi:MAG: NAD-dependent epimerase/dehydratase family protein [Verrucomicrobiota bacterium]|nr:NAD-dependent epimerase/dehydratase family protein [Verrucomicrobiota bacterium]
MWLSTIFITGATGFIGRHLVNNLLAENHNIRIYCRDGQKARRLFGKDIDYVQGDILDSASLVKAMQGCNQVIHLAGCYEFGHGAAARLYQTNVTGTQNMMSAAWTNGVEKMVHVSTAGFLGTGQKPINERAFPLSPSIFCPYKRSKWQSENIVLSWHRKGLPVCIASPTCPIGDGDETPTPTGRMILDFLKRDFPFSCRTGINLVDVDDLARGLVLTLKNGQPGERYILGHHNLWLSDFLKEISILTDIPAPKIHIPWGVIMAAGAACESWHLITRNTHSQRVCLETAILSRREQFFDMSKAAKNLGWTPSTPLKETLAKSIEWFNREIFLNQKRISHSYPVITSMDNKKPVISAITEMTGDKNK